MSAVWFCLPSARPSEQAEIALSRWRDKGYKLAVFRELERGPVAADILVNTLPYPGYARAANLLIDLALKEDSDCDWVAVGADDIWPDPNYRPEDIEDICSCHFNGFPPIPGEGLEFELEATFGVMQPTGDRWGDAQGAYVDRVATSPWIGREFAKRMYRGRGPYWPEYTHMGADEELRFVAMQYGVYWGWRDLTHWHDHWGRPREGEIIGQRNRMPAFLEHANSPQEWARYKRIFNERRAAGFPGCEPLGEASWFHARPSRL